MAVNYERPEGKNKDIKHLIENSNDSDDTGSDDAVNDVDDIPAISSSLSMVQPECFYQSELNDLVFDLGLSKGLVELLSSTVKFSSHHKSNDARLSLTNKVYTSCLTSCRTT